MSNQANSIANDLMVGAGTLYFERFDDTHGLHHLGNVDEFNITTDVTTVEKNSSMNKKRELMASVVTAVAPTATLTMTEYNPYNLALGLFGVENVHKQGAETLTAKGYTITSVPGVLELLNDDGERYFNVTELVIGLNDPQPAKFEWTTTSSDYSISTVAKDNDTLTDNHIVNIPAKFNFVSSSFSPTDYTGTDTVLTDAVGGGTITLDASGMTGTSTSNVLIEVTTAPTAAGDLTGMEVEVTVDSGSPTTYSSMTGASDDITLANGCKITFAVGITDTFTPVSSGVQANAIPASTKSAGGVFTLDPATFTGTTDSSVYITVVSGTTNDGDLDGLQLNVIEGGIGGVQVFNGTAGATSQTFVLSSGATITADVTTNTGFVTNSSVIDAELIAATSEYVAGRDYIVDEHMLRGGIVQIPANSRMKAGDLVTVTAKVPEGDFVTVSGANAGEINGRLLFIGDPNIGGQYTIEAWKVKVQPDGDFTGLIGTDFGSFNLTITFLSDYENHPNYPYYRATLNGRADGKSAKEGIYDPNY